ncbi:MBL fold metallo-hydrolase [Nocardia sp. NPDC005366]|uniref:MBL fold metallo-hydrolase n=1 Tax=Nocardia sp. NPDC005366 TaxID=3156878 RepID=UPI0033A8DAA2
MTVTNARLTRPAGLRRAVFGHHRVTYLPDGVALLDARRWLPDADDQVWRQFAALLDPDGYLVASVGALLIEYGDRAMLIDAGFGPLAVPTPVGQLRGGQLIDSLAAAGKSVNDIDLVALTHLHMDHIGWLWQAHTDTTINVFAGIPVLASATEWELRELAVADGTPPEVLATFADQIRPLPDGEFFPGVRALPTPGHSLGHTSYLLDSLGERLVVFGDALTTPVQITHPHLASSADDDPAQSRDSAARLLRELAEPYTRGFGMHFADIQFGRVVTHEHTTHWQPE